MLVLLLFVLFITPVQLTLHWQQGLELRLRVWGISRSHRVPPPAKGQQGTPHQQLMRLLGTVLRTDKARRFLFRHTQVVRLQALVYLGLQDAAATAILTGLLRQLALLLPRRADVRVQPNFLGSTQVQARCILFFHLGTILITAVMGLAAYLMECREHPIPHPKEA